MSSIPHEFTQPLLAWFDQHGRKDLPWQHPRSAYYVWLSEIMLQQTQVKTVIPYFTRFIHRFPTIKALAEAQDDEVLSLWSGLGYYSRARNLHKAAKQIQAHHGGEFPTNIDDLIQLPGIGRTTAAAITSQAFNQPDAILDGNVKRVLSRYFLVEGEPNHKTTHAQLWAYATQCMDATRCVDYSQAIMDLGATCCTHTKPTCDKCPLNATCGAKRLGAVAQYPAKKQKNKLPEQHHQFLLMHNAHADIYLEKRPASGIWGGLWCTPVIAMDENPKTYLETTYAWSVDAIEPLKTIKHTFSHFKLHINALSIKIRFDQRLNAPESGMWFSIQDTNKLGLPKPIMDLIREFKGQNPLHVKEIK